MTDPFYKAPKLLLADPALSPAEKLVRIVQGHYLAFEGREATRRELREATGLSEAGVRKALRAQSASAQSARRFAQSARKSAQSARSGRDACSKSFVSLRDVEREGETMTTSPSPSDTPNEKKQTHGPSLGWRLAHRAVRPADEKEWAAFAEETVRRCGREALTAFLAFHEYFVFWPRELPERVSTWWQEERRRRWDERLRQVREGNLKAAEPVLGPRDQREAPSKDLRYRVHWADDGVLAIERQTLVRDRWAWDGTAYRSEYRFERMEEAGRCWRLRPDGAFLPGVEW